MTYRKNRSRHNGLESIIRRDYLSMGWLAQMLERIQDSKVRGRYQEYGILCNGIRKFQRELKTSVSEFPQFGLLGRRLPQKFDSENYWPDSSSCAQTQKELEDYRLQELPEDPFRIEREPDLSKEQEEYFRRIRQGFVDPGSYG